MTVVRAARSALAAGLMHGLTACAGGAVTMVDYPAYETVGDLAAVADVVVQGVVLDERTEDIVTLMDSTSDDPNLNPQAGLPDDDDPPEPPAEPFLVYRIEVGTDFTGALRPGDVIEVKVWLRETSEPEPRLAVGDEYLLFLSEAYGGGIPRSLLNPDQAAYRVEADGTFSTLRPDSTIALNVTRADLDGLAD